MRGIFNLGNIIYEVGGWPHEGSVLHKVCTNRYINITICLVFCEQFVCACTSSVCKSNVVEHVRFHQS